MPFDYQYLRERGVPAAAASRIAGGGTTTATSPVPATDTLAGAPAFNYAGAYGGIPQVPNPTATAGGAAAGNLDNLPAIKDLATQTTTLNNALARSGYEANMPGYGSMLGKASANAGNLLAGILPPDVLRQIQQTAAERAVAIGSSDSPNSNAAMLRALGLTSLDLQGKGAEEFGKLVHLTPTGPAFNPATMMVSPGDVQAAQTAANVYSASPIPWQAAQANLNAMLTGLNRGQSAAGGGVYIPSAPTAPGSRVPAYPGMQSQPTAPGVSGGYGSLTETPGSDPFLDEILTRYGENPTGMSYEDKAYWAGLYSMPESEPYARVSDTEYSYPQLSDFYDEEY